MLLSQLSDFHFFCVWLYRIKGRILFENFNPLFSNVSPNSASMGAISYLRTVIEIIKIRCYKLKYIFKYFTAEEKTPLKTLMPGKMPVGRPKRHWVNIIERNARDLGLKETWTQRAINRVGHKWRGIVVAALGSQNPMLPNKWVS